MRFRAIEIVVAVLLAAGITVGILAIAAKQKTKTVTRTVVKTKVVQTRFTGPQSFADFLNAAGGQTQCPPSLNGAVCYQFQAAELFAFLAVPAA